MAYFLHYDRIRDTLKELVRDAVFSLAVVSFATLLYSRITGGCIIEYTGSVFRSSADEFSFVVAFSFASLTIGRLATAVFSFRITLRGTLILFSTVTLTAICIFFTAMLVDPSDVPKVFRFVYPLPAFIAVLTIAIATFLTTCLNGPIASLGTASNGGRLCDGRDSTLWIVAGSWAAASFLLGGVTYFGKALMWSLETPLEVWQFLEITLCFEIPLSIGGLILLLPRHSVPTSIRIATLLVMFGTALFVACWRR